MNDKKLTPELPSAGETTPKQKYGDARRRWAPEYEAYMEKIVRHKNYAGMPDAIDADGVIRWNAPTGRPAGRWQDLHDRRKRWWEAKAKVLGMAHTGAGWISAVVKAIHPFGSKPCQTCGKSMLLAYVYPTKRVINRLNTAMNGAKHFAYSDYRAISDLIPEFIDATGAGGFDVLIKLFPELSLAKRSVAGFVDTMNNKIVPSEPKGALSPGSMSNAPDRLDGFHSYNLCCRPSQDTGRAADNLRTYSDDRRAFEYWCEGDWAAANLLMTKCGVGRCPECGKTKKMTADHIGPISLGFTHRPNFRAMCKSCNSTKGNRLTLEDVRSLIGDEAAGESVASFHIKKLWDRCKSKVVSEDDAKKLATLLRINQHYYLELLHEIYRLGYTDLLLHYLNADYAAEKVEFEGLDASNLKYDSIMKTKRADTYAKSKACRAVRIAFDSLIKYSDKGKRNIHLIPANQLENKHCDVVAALQAAGNSGQKFRMKLKKMLSTSHFSDDRKSQEIGRLLGSDFGPRSNYDSAYRAITAYMDEVGRILSDGF